MSGPGGVGPAARPWRSGEAYEAAAFAAGAEELDELLGELEDSDELLDELEDSDELEELELSELDPTSALAGVVPLRELRLSVL